MLEHPLKTWFLWGIEPALDMGNPARTSTALGQAEFVVACTTHHSASLAQCADILLPIAAFAETSGTLVNADVTWQSFRGAVSPPGEARPGWKVLRVLGNLLNLPGFEQVSSAEVLGELQTLCAGVDPDNTLGGAVVAKPASKADGLTRIGNVPIYSVDVLVRRAPALQSTPAAGRLGAFMSRAQAEAMGLAEGDEVEVSQSGPGVRTKVILDQAVPDECLRVPAAVAGSEALGDQIGPIAVVKI
jgi:NADH-quinone oxidoreductase subunit G